jgi:ubiquinone/menaquinone biosynthesis C-methylase UbiE
VDLGCGQGACSTLVEANARYIGVDLSEKLIARAIELYKEPNKQFLHGDVYKIPRETESADAVMSIWVWSHLKNLPQAAVEMHRILKINGNFLIITANPETYEVRKTYYKELKDYGNYLVGTFDLGNGKYLTNTTLQLHTKEQMVDSIIASGLKIDSIETFGLFEDDPRGMYIDIRGHKE